ncbi:hypothetical protein RBH26_13000 [Natronolimnohabitans sp. A-GB9]|uniref:hypothetical protein n=1 Tax=Natronolimnohabitans sp. A-GB9 TaxID=3069757 RepID=UPI0027B4261F|nr:hypothetical protein [Natronolimnohabitans sp. A-GB9]MDQ2051394.1 hypothetical protein [Natronolimnohabitans sp. A-GB9]
MFSVSLSLEPDLDRILDEYGDFRADCADAGRTTTEIGGYVYRAQFWYACNGTETEYLVLAGVPEDWMGPLILPDKTMHTPIALETLSRNATDVETRSGVY